MAFLKKAFIDIKTAPQYHRCMNCIRLVSTARRDYSGKERYLIELNYRDSRPIYEQIKDSIRRLVISGAMGSNEQLPSVRSLAVTLSINPNTIQRAYNELENEGYIYSVPGKGNFVSPDVRQDKERIKELKERLIEILAELKYLGLKNEELEELIRETV